MPPTALSPNASTLSQPGFDDEAQRINDLIDEALKKDALGRKEAKKKEVRVLLLGQAESGKSTLQKQFQLYYASHTLERERPSWRPAVYLNIIRAIHKIFHGVEQELTLVGFDANYSEPGNIITPRLRDELTQLESNLQPLLDAEAPLASGLNGGLSGSAAGCVRTGWQSLMKAPRTDSDSTCTTKNSHATLHAADMLWRLRDEMKTLWSNPLVKDLHSRRKLRIEESAPFFLHELDRICDPEYLPITDDILHVRMQTLGVFEHSFSVAQGGIDYTWCMYDVGGARGQRHAWIPYFDDATAILFLAPISAFDQQLEEDPKTNRLEDSLHLFTVICSSKLLRNANIILLLNKIDLLKQKLESGRKVRKYIPTYGNRKNTFEDVSEYFKAHFTHVYRRCNTTHHGLFVHFTTMVDTGAMQKVIAGVGDAIIRKHIAESGLA